MVQKSRKKERKKVRGHKRIKTQKGGLFNSKKEKEMKIFYKIHINHNINNYKEIYNFMMNAGIRDFKSFDDYKRKIITYCLTHVEEEFKKNSTLDDILRTLIYKHLNENKHIYDKIASGIKDIYVIFTKCSIYKQEIKSDNDINRQLDRLNVVDLDKLLKCINSNNTDIENIYNLIQSIIEIIKLKIEEEKKRLEDEKMKKQQREMNAIEKMKKIKEMERIKEIESIEYEKNYQQKESARKQEENRNTQERIEKQKKKQQETQEREEKETNEYKETMQRLKEQRNKEVVLLIGNMDDINIKKKIDELIETRKIVLRRNKKERNKTRQKIIDDYKKSIEKLYNTLNSTNNHENTQKEINRREEILHEMNIEMEKNEINTMTEHHIERNLKSITNITNEEKSEIELLKNIYDIQNRILYNDKKNYDKYSYYGLKGDFGEAFTDLDMTYEDVLTKIETNKKNKIQNEIKSQKIVEKNTFPKAPIKKFWGNAPIGYWHNPQNMG